MNELVERRIAPVISQRLSETPVLLLEGPRSVGKSVLLSQLASTLGKPVLDLDEITYRQLANNSPTAVADGATPVLIDEYQRAPILLDAIKARLNRGTKPGMFVLAGSTSFDSLPPGTQALTGRLQRLPIMPLTQTEIDGTSNDLIAAAFEGEVAHSTRPATSTRTERIMRVMRGGMPLALAQESEPARSRWFAAHVRESITRDAGALRRIGRTTDLHDVLVRTVGQTGSLLNISKVAEQVKPSRGTTSDYLELLESLFLIQRLPSWGVTLLPRTIETPKVHVIDSGIGAYLLRLSTAKLERLDPAALTEFGHLFESFVVQEVVRQTTWMDAPVAVGYWRTKDKLEVDLVLERSDGAVLGIEIKAGDHIPGKELGPMMALRNRLGRSFMAGLVFYQGLSGYVAGDRIHVLPVERLWV